MSDRTRFCPYLHNLKFPLDFIVVCITLERLLQLFYLMDPVRGFPCVLFRRLADASLSRSGDSSLCTERL